METTMKNLLSGLVFVLLLGCQPRGETKSLSEVLAGEKARFYAEAERKLPKDVQSELTQAATALEELEVKRAGDEVTRSADSLILALRSLNLRAGYTTRPALNELLKQWKALQNENQLVGSTSRLLIARTYGLLSSELKGVRFALKERELRL
jgi:hypothetical protein